MSNFDTALSIANYAHEGQLDKGGLPYILHPLHVASFFTGELKIMALLHDVVEDSDIAIDDLENYGFSERILAAIEAITRQQGEPYEVYINRMAKNPDAVAVKLRDLEHNMDLTRLKVLDKGCWPRLKRYLSAYRLLGQQ